MLLGLCVLLPPAVSAQAQAERAAPPQATAAAPLVLRGVTVIDVEAGRRLADRTVVIVGNRIQRIESNPKTRVPAGAQVVDAQGKYLIPGLWDMHVHPNHYVDIAYPLFLANGITGVRDAGSEVPLATFQRWKQEIAAGTRVGPRLIVSGSSIDEARPGDVGANMNAVTQGVGFATHKLAVPPALIRQVVDSFHAAGADMLKLYGMSSAMRRAAAAEARRVGIPFGGHSADMQGIEFSDSGATILDHNTWTGVCGNWDGDADRGKYPYNTDQCVKVLRRLRRNKTWIAWNQVNVNGLHLARDLDFVLRYQPRSRLARPADAPVRLEFDSLMKAWNVAGRVPPVPTTTAEWVALLSADSFHTSSLTPEKDKLALLRQHGAIPPIVAATDAGIGGMPLFFSWLPGFMLHEVLEAYVLVGLTPLEALQTATRNPAQALRATDSLGTVAVGKVADLVLLNADPLADIWHTTSIRAVVANGRYYDRAALDGLLAQAEAAAARQ